MNCENCKNIIGDNDQIFSIPIDETWKWKEGTYCSIKCALYVNKNEFSIRRPAEDIKNREKWLLEKEEFDKNKKFK